MKTLQKFDIYPGANCNPVETIDNSHNYKRVSRWIEIKHNYTPNSRNALWDYVTDENGYHPYQDNFNPDNGLYLDYFKWNGRTYAVEQFAAFGSVMDCIGHSTGYVENGEKHYLSGYDMDNYYNPVMIELDEYGERCRVYIEV